MHCEFPDVTNAFQMRFDELSNSKGNKGDRTLNKYRFDCLSTLIKFRLWKWKILKSFNFKIKKSNYECSLLFLDFEQNI